MTSKPKIAVIGAKGFPAWGGAARTSEAVFTRLVDKFDVTVYAIDSHAKDETYLGIKQKIYKSYNNAKISVFLYYLKSLLHALIKGRYDLIHVNHRAAGFVVPFLRIRFPVVLNVHGMPLHHGTADYKKLNTKWTKYELKLFDFFQWLGFKFATKIITVEKSSVAIIEKYNPFNVYFIPNGVDINLSFTQTHFTQKYEIAFSAARILYLKGLHLLLFALNEIKFEGHVLIIGDLDQDESYNEKILKISKSLRCEFAGLLKNRNELFKKISQSKLYVFPSYSEGMSNMLLEVASLKVPVIASDISQNTDVFDRTEMTFFKKGDYKDLSYKLKVAIANDTFMQEKAERAYKKILSKHNWNTIALKYSTVYRMILKKQVRSF